jgi:NDP-sugar pyrophosphorylase family protein
MTQPAVTMPPIAVIAGGLATRMHPLTLTVAKSMLPVVGEPFIAHQLRLFRREGISRVVLCLSHLGETVEAFIGAGTFDLEVLYAYDGDRQMGTGGALAKALPLLGPEFLVTYGDSYLDINFAPVVAAFRRAGAPALMTVFKNDDRLDRSNVEFVNGRIANYSKTHDSRMAHIDFGLQALRADCIADAAARDQPFDLASIYTDLAQQGRLAGFEVGKRFYEIGSKEGLAETDAYLLSKQEVTS